MKNDKTYIHLHVDIDEYGKLILADDDGRILAGVVSNSLHTSCEDISHVNLKIMLKDKDHKALARGRVK